ncbi:MAG: undecaprenyl-diphosphate phosphatase [Planctomycetaceae bacterium]
MREYIAAIILGIVQGITEFLPISSDGHLVIVENLLARAGGGIDTKGSLLTFVAQLHIGTLMSIIVVYRHDLWRLTKQPRTCLAIVVATIPAVIVGFTLKDWIETSLQTPMAAGIGLLVTAAFLFAATLFERKEAATEDVSMPTALAIGVFQALALLPGVSRSGTTISTGLIAGLRRQISTSFSFLIAVPVVFGAIVLTAKDVIEGSATIAFPGALAVGIAVSFVVGWAALRWLIRIVSQNKLHWFAWYCAIVGVVTIVWQLVA